MPYIAISGSIIIVCYSTAKVARLVMSDKAKDKLKDKLKDFLDLFAIKID